MKVIAGPAGTGKTLAILQMLAEMRRERRPISASLEDGLLVELPRNREAWGDPNPANTQTPVLTPADFEVFAASARPILIRIVRPVLPPSSQDQAEDVAQTTLVAVWRKWLRSGAPKDPIAYAVRVALRLARVYVQKEAELRTTLIEEDLPESASTHDIEAVPLRIDLDRAVVRLPNRQRAIVRQHLAGKTNQEIAQLFKISPGTVGAQLHAARRTLRAWLNDWIGR